MCTTGCQPSRTPSASKGLELGSEYRHPTQHSAGELRGTVPTDKGVYGGGGGRGSYLSTLHPRPQGAYLPVRGKQKGKLEEHSAAGSQPKDVK